MHRLAMLSTHSKQLLLSQFLLLKEKLEQKGATFSFIHKFLAKIEYKEQKYFIKINVLDNEFYLFSTQQNVLFFHSFSELRGWIEIHILQGDVESDPI